MPKAAGAVIYPLSLVFIGVMAYGFYRRFLRYGIRPQAALAELVADAKETGVARLRNVVSLGLLHKKITRRPFAGAFHWFIYGGMLLLTLGTMTVALQQDLLSHIGVTVLKNGIYFFFEFALDTAALFFVAGCLMALGRRLLAKPDYLENTRDAVPVLLLLLFLGVSGLLLVGLLLFLPAGTFAFRQAWLLIGILFIPMFLAGLVMMQKSPALLRRRLDAREAQPEQRAVIALSGLMFLAAFIVAGLNFRFGWIVLPDWVSYVSAVVFLLAYGLYAEVLRENVWLSRTIEVQENQKVIDTGLYGLVRHPMYMSTLLLFLAMPLVLGSVISLAIMLAYIPIIARRIRNEEQVLESGLEGYTDYKKRVRYKVIPFVW